MFAKRMGLMKNQPLHDHMAHLDFRQAFSSSADPAHPVVELAPAASAAEEAASRKQKRTLATRLPRLQQSDRTTFLFAILIFVGGLFCAFFFFNGAEILRAAAAWSREFLYPRPAALAQNKDQADALKPALAPNLPPAAPSRDSERDPDRSANTFPLGRNNGSSSSAFSPDSPAGGPNAPIGTLLPSPGSLPQPGSLADPSSLLGQLNLLPPGDDALSEVMNQAAHRIAHVARLHANSLVTVIKVPVSQATKKTPAQARASRRAAQNTVANAATKQNLKNSAQQASQAVGSARSEIGSLSRFEPPTMIIGGTSLGNRIGGIGGLGTGLGGGSMGGSAGTAASTGGLGGTVGGLLGGH